MGKKRHVSDFVQVNPERLDQLAAAIKDAAALIPDKATSMSTSISGWDASWDAAKVKALGTWLEGQWRDMEDRADLGRTAMHVTRMYSADDPKGWWPGIPWVITPEIKAQEGQQDAVNLQKDLNSGDDTVTTNARSELAAAMEAHKDDPTWMQAFYANGGANAIDTANKQLLGDHVPIPDENQVFLKKNADGVAAATKAAELGTITVPADAFGPLYDDDSVMATGVMMKFGPTSGTSYGAPYLAAIGQAAITWRKNHQPPRPGYSEGNMAQGQVPKFVGDGWWNDYGLELKSSTTDSIPDQQRKVGLIGQYDPSLNILNLVGDSETASQALLGGDKGADNAKVLVNYNWATPGFGDDSAVPGKVIRAATLDRTPPADGPSAHAAANVFAAGQDLYTHDWRNDYDKEQFPQIPAELAKSLAAVATAYLPDMAASTGRSSGVNVAVKDPTTGQWVLQTNQQTMDGYLSIFMQDSKAAGTFQGAVNNQLTNASTAAQKWPKEATDLLQQTGYLNGMVQIVMNQQNYSEAEATDAANAQNKAYFDMATGVLSAVPLGEVPKYVDFIKGTTETMVGAAEDSMFPDGAADAADSKAQYDTNQKLSDMRLYVAQGYANAGTYPTPAGASFVHDGVIAPQNEQEKGDFDQWYAAMPKPLADQNDAAQGYLEAAGQFAHGDDKFQNPES